MRASFPLGLSVAALLVACGGTSSTTPDLDAGAADSGAVADDRPPGSDPAEIVDTPRPDAPAVDLGAEDSGALDAGSPDIGVSDAAPLDSGPADAGPADTGEMDTGPTDTGPADTGPADTGPADTGPMDTGPMDTGRWTPDLSMRAPQTPDPQTQGLRTLDRPMRARSARLRRAPAAAPVSRRR